MEHTKTIKPAPISNIGGPFSYEVDRLLGLAFDVEEVINNAPPACFGRLANAVAIMREIADELTPSDKSEAPFQYDLASKLREWADLADRTGLDSKDIGNMAHELKCTARAIADGLCFIGPVSPKGEAGEAHETQV